MEIVNATVTNAAKWIYNTHSVYYRLCSEVLFQPIRYQWEINNKMGLLYWKSMNKPTIIIVCEATLLIQPETFLPNHFKRMGCEVSIHRTKLHFRIRLDTPHIFKRSLSQRRCALTSLSRQYKIGYYVVTACSRQQVISTTTTPSPSPLSWRHRYPRRLTHRVDWCLFRRRFVVLALAQQRGGAGTR